MVVLICISLILVMLSIFLCACWPSACLLWKNVYSDLLSIFKLNCIIFTIELYEFLIYFGYNAFSHSVGCLFILLIVSFAEPHLFLNVHSGHKDAGVRYFLSSTSSQPGHTPESLPNSAIMKSLNHPSTRGNEVQPRRWATDLWGTQWLAWALALGTLEEVDSPWWLLPGASCTSPLLTFVTLAISCLMAATQCVFFRYIVGTQQIFVTWPPLLASQSNRGFLEERAFWAGFWGSLRGFGVLLWGGTSI